MKLLNLKTKSPYFNLAVEEYLFKESDTDVIILWQNEPSVVIGKNQNAYAELNLDYIKEKGINVSRRITGGGAVYHDIGNLNFSFISLNTTSEGIDFKRYTEPIIEALRYLGVPAELSGRNDILVDGKKISGNAQYSVGNRVLHHGTLLFDTDFSRLASALLVDEEKIKAKSIKSYRSRVANIKDYLEGDYTVEEFREIIAEYLKKRFSLTEMDMPKDEEILRLEKRNKSKEWLFPERSFVADYTLIKSKRFPFGGIRLELFMKNERVENAALFGDYFEINDSRALISLLVGKTLTEIKEKAGEFHVDKYIHGLNKEYFRELLES